MVGESKDEGMHGDIQLIRFAVQQEHNTVSQLCMHTCALSHFSCVQLFATVRTVARQALLSVGFSRQEYWSGFPWPPPGDLPDPGD